jgi:hypothetical protein
MQDVSQWGTDIDQSYMDKIGQQIKQWWTGQQQGAGGTPTSTPTPSGSVLDFIRQWQGSHAATEGIGPLADALKNAGYTNVSRYMYGSTPSNNELLLDGQKYKVLGGELTPAAYWYQSGMDDSPGAMGGGYPGGGGAPAPAAPSGPRYTPLRKRLPS